MKIKLIISMAIAAAVGSNAFALEISKGKLISHKEWATAGAKAAYLPGTKTRQNIQDIKGMKLSESSNAVYSDTESTTAKVGEPVTVGNDGYVWIYNASEAVKNYRFEYSICADQTANIMECVYSEDVVELQPHGYVSDSRKPTVTMKYDTAGSYNIYAGAFYMTENGWTRVFGDSAGTITVS